MDPLPTNTELKYKLRNPLQPSDRRFIVWELNQPKLNLYDVPETEPFDLAEAILEASHGN